MLHVRPLRRDKIDQLFPLLRIAIPTLTLGEWRSYAARVHRTSPRTPGRRGVIIAETATGYIRGTLTYSVESRLGRGRILVVRHFVAPPLGRARVAGALCREIEGIAWAHRCLRCEVELPADACWEVRFFREQGFHVLQRLAGEDELPDPTPAALGGLPAPAPAEH